MKKTQGGFTLIELIVVIVLLGILGVTALARFQDLAGEARVAVTEGVASELTGAANINYATRLLNPAAGTPLTAADVCTNAILAPLLLNGFPAEVAVDPVTGTGVAGDCATAGEGGQVQCQLIHTGGETALTNLICSG